MFPQPFPPPGWCSPAVCCVSAQTSASPYRPQMLVGALSTSLRPRPLPQTFFFLHLLLPNMPWKGFGIASLLHKKPLQREPETCSPCLPSMGPWHPTQAQSHFLSSWSQCDPVTVPWWTPNRSQHPHTVSQARAVTMAMYRACLLPAVHASPPPTGAASFCSEFPFLGCFHPSSSPWSGPLLLNEKHDVLGRSGLTSHCAGFQLCDLGKVAVLSVPRFLPQ